MAAVANVSKDRIQIFRTRAVLVAGLIDLIFGLAILVVGLGLAAWGKGRDTLPLGLALAVVALVLVLSGLSRMTARLEVGPHSVAWRWSFSRFEVPLTDLDDADLVEKGSPASGASWAGFLGGGLFGVVALWIVELAAAFLSSEPGLGPYELVVIKHHGGAVAVKPIGAWSTRSSHSQANDAVRAIKKAISSSAGRVLSPAPPPAALRYDAWDSIRDS